MMKAFSSAAFNLSKCSSSHFPQMHPISTWHIPLQAKIDPHQLSGLILIEYVVLSFATHVFGHFPLTETRKAVACWGNITTTVGQQMTLYTQTIHAICIVLVIHRKVLCVFSAVDATNPTRADLSICFPLQINSVWSS